MKAILALDQGTTSSRAIVFDRDGHILGAAQKEFRQIFPRPGWVEHDPREIRASQIGVAVEALASARIGAKDLAALGIANQRETTVVWDRRTGEPVHNAIVWQDRRTADRMARLKAEGREPMIREKTGLVADAYFSASKVEWILDHVEGARRRAEAGDLVFGTIDSWLLFQLTGGRVHATDASNASRTLLFNIRSGDWDDELLALFNVPRAMMPDVRESSEIYAETDNSLPIPGVPIGGIAGDQQAALAGQACVRPGMAKNTYGTGCFMLLNTGETPARSVNRLLTTVAWRLGGRTQYALEGSVFVAGAVAQWLRDGLGLIRSAPEIETLAASVPDNGGVVFVPAFTGLGAPHWDPYARGAVFGLTRGATSGHLARAALESIAFQVADLHDAMKADLIAARTTTGTSRPRRGHNKEHSLTADYADITNNADNANEGGNARESSPVSELRVDGGAAANNLLMQIQADLLQTPIARPKVTETTALGAAYLAGLAVGYWNSVGDLAAHWQIDRRFEPRLSEPAAASLRSRWREAVRRAGGWEAPDPQK